MCMCVCINDIVTGDDRSSNDINSQVDTLERFATHKAKQTRNVFKIKRKHLLMRITLRHMMKNLYTLLLNDNFLLSCYQYMKQETLYFLLSVKNNYIAIISILYYSAKINNWMYMFKIISINIWMRIKSQFRLEKKFLKRALRYVCSWL